VKVPEGSRTSRPTLEAVAAHAGVSRATVSRVVNGDAGVRPSMREQVLRSVEELGYVPNHAARSLVTRRHDAVAVVIGEPETKVFGDPYFSRALRGISRELSAADQQLVLLLVEDENDYRRVGRYLAGGHVDGALLFSLHRDDPLPAQARAARLPAVLGSSPWDPEPGTLYVDSDNHAGAAAATRHLTRTLRRRVVGTVTGPSDIIAGVDRLRGFREVCPKADDDLIEEGDFTAWGGERATLALLERRPDVDGLFVASDLMASGALAALRRCGRRVPEDVAVVGFDDIDEIAPVADPPLTTVRQEIEGLGRSMARLLLRLVAEGPEGLEPVVQPTRLVLRGSA
jgi:DNA-binding LacI/PurR family transcriptional regulator